MLRLLTVLLLVSVVVVGRPAYADGLITGSQEAVQTMTSLTRVVKQQQDGIEQAFASNKAGLDQSISTSNLAILAFILLLVAVGLMLFVPPSQQKARLVLAGAGMVSAIFGVLLLMLSGLPTKYIVDNLSVVSTVKEAYRPFREPLCKQLAEQGKRWKHLNLHGRRMDSSECLRPQDHCGGAQRAKPHPRRE